MPNDKTSTITVNWIMPKSQQAVRNYANAKYGDKRNLDLKEMHSRSPFTNK